MENRTFLSPSKLKAAIIYVFLLLIGSVLVSGLVGMIVGSIRGVDPGSVFLAFFQTTPDENVKVCQTIALGYSNFICYLLSSLGVAFYLRNYLVEDFNKIKEKKKYYLILIPILAISFAGIAYLVDFLFSKIVTSSENQKTIIMIMNSSARVPMIISTVILAPFVEELIYRKAIFEGLRKYSLIPCYVVSIICFALPHMLSAQENIGVWFLQLLPYMILGGMLCFVYHISNHNVYASISAHMLNNLVAVILVFI